MARWQAAKLHHGRITLQSQRWESNPHTPHYEYGARPIELRRRVSIPVRSRTPSSTFEASRASTTLRGCHSEPRPGIEPGPRPSESRVLSVAPPGPKIRGLESNQHSRVQGPLAYQLADPGVEWPRRDLNPHVRRRPGLSRVRLPFPPPGRTVTSSKGGI